MAIKFFIEYEGTTVLLPVNPETLTKVRGGNNETAEIVGIGEVTVIKRPKLFELPLEGYLPMYPNGINVLTKNDFKPPTYYGNFINKIRTDKKPCRLVVSDIGINMLVTVENWETSHIAMDNDVHYKLELKEYREYKVKNL